MTAERTRGTMVHRKRAVGSFYASIDSPLLPMFRTDPVYVNIGEIILGILGFSVGIYARQGAGNNPQASMLSQQKNGMEQQEKEMDQQRKEIDQRGEENIKR